MKAEHRNLAIELRTTIADIDKQLQTMKEEQAHILRAGDEAGYMYRDVEPEEAWDALLRSKYPDGSHSAAPLLLAKAQALSALAVLATDK